jgi:hypothetical protein
MAAVARTRALRPLQEEVRRRDESVRSSERRLVLMEQGLEPRQKPFRRQVPAGDRGNLERARAEVASSKELATAAQAALRAAELANRANPWPDTHAPQLNRVAALDAQIRHLSAARGRELSGSSPTYLVAELGEPNGRNDHTWQHAAGEIESYRARWGVEDPQEPLPSLSRGAEIHRLAVRDQLADLGYSLGTDGITRA